MNRYDVFINSQRESLWRPAAGIVILFLSGCAAVGPDYAPPETNPPAAWATELQSGLTDTRIDDPRMLANWWITLNDRTLSSLIERAVVGSVDMQVARARVREARARRGMSEADRFPTLTAGGSASRKRSSKEAGSGATTELYNAGFDASWELDVFGGVRRAVEAADAELQASEEDLRDVLISLIAEVALNYVELRTFQTRLYVAKENLKSQEETYHITQWRHQAGMITELDVDQARFNLDQLRSDIPSLYTGLEQAKNRIAVLLGRQPGALSVLLDERKSIPLTPLEIGVGLPAEALRRRPDVRRAERQLAAQTARIGVATAASYPDFSLAGSIGLESLMLGNLFTAGAKTASIAGNVGWTLFDAGRIRENIEVKTALQEQLLKQYEATVLAALEDVENALLAYVNEQARRHALINGSQAAQRAVALALHEYDSGLVDFQVVLDAQRSSLSLQNQLAISEGELTSNLIRLYKALGGGWESQQPAVTQPERVIQD